MQRMSGRQGCIEGRNRFFFLTWQTEKMKWESSAQLELSFFSCSTSLSSASMASKAVASSAVAAVFGLSFGFSEGSTIVASRLVLHPMSWQNARVGREMFSRVCRQERWRRAQTRVTVVSSGTSALHGNFMTSF